MEAIIGLVMVALLIGAGLTGLQTLGSTSSAVNQTARLDALLVSAGEAVQKAEYVDCARPNNYQTAIENWENQRVADQRIVQQSASVIPSFEILTVDLGVADCETSLAGDAGSQKITLSATMDGKTRQSTVRKINPKKRLRLPQAVIDYPETGQSPPGNIMMAYSFTAADSTGDEGLVSYTWDCGPDAEPLTDTNALPGALDPNKATKLVFGDGRTAMFCAFQSELAIKQVTVYLTVEDSLGQTSSTKRTIDIPARTDPSLPPIAVASVTSSVPANSYAPLTVTFTSAGSEPVDGALVGWEWNFGDAASGTSNVATGQTASHTFYQAGPHEVTLTVTSDSGLSDSDSVTVTVVVPGVPLPVARFADPGDFYNPAQVTFDATTSTPASGPNRIVQYDWDFGDGSIAVNGGATPVHTYTQVKNYTVTLTVKDATAQSATTTWEVVVRRLDPPLDLVAINAQSTFPCVFFFCPGERPGFMDFGWNRVRPGPGDTLSMDINIMRASGGINPCWINPPPYDPPGRTRSVAQTGTSGYQTYRWTQITWSPISPVDFDNMFCAGSTYEYRYRVKRVAPNGTFFGPWSQTKTRGI